MPGGSKPVPITLILTTVKRTLSSLGRGFLFKLNGWTLSALFLGLLAFIPIAAVLWHLTNPSENWKHLEDTVLTSYLKDSLILVCGTVFLSVLAGVSCAWVVSCCEFPGRKVFEWVLVLPLAVPTFIAAYAYFDLLAMIEEEMIPLIIWARTNSPEDLDTVIFLLDSLKYPVTILVMASVLYPYVYLLARASFSRQGSQLIEAARTLGYSPRSIFFRVALPLARPAIVAGASLVVMETLNDYGAVKHFGVSTFTNGIFRTWFAMNDLPGALRLAALLMLFILFLLVVERILRSGAKFEEKGNAARTFQRYRLGPIGSTLAILCCLLPLTSGFFIPLGRLSLWASESYLKILDSSFFELIANSLGLAVASSILIVLFATFLAFAERYFKSPTVRASNRLAILGYSVPGAVVAMAIILIASPLNLSLGILLTGSLFTLLFAYLIRFLAVAWQPIDSGMEKNCDRLNEASQSLKAKPLISLLKINLPLIRPSLWAAGLLVFVDTMKELPLTLILRPFNFETLSTRTYDLTSQAQIPESSVPALCIILVVVFPVIWLNRKMEARK